MSSFRSIMAALAIVAVLSVGSVAIAGPIGTIDPNVPLFSLHVVGPEGSGINFHRNIMPDRGSLGADGMWHWSMTQPWTITDGNGQPAGSLDQGQVTVNFDPYIDVAFHYINSSGLPVHVSVTQPSVLFAPILNPLAVATAGMTLSTNGDGGSTLGSFPGPRSYEAYYNGTSTYAFLVRNLTDAVGNNTVSDSERSPAVGYGVIPGLVSQIDARFEFDLSPGDNVGGSSHFEVIPEPATMGMLAFGMAVILRRRRA